MNTKYAFSVVSIYVYLALAGCGGSSGGGGGVNQQPPPGGGPAAPEAVTVDLGDAVKNVVIQPNTATQFTVTYTMPADLFSEPYTSYGGFRMKLTETMGNVRLTSAMVADNGDPVGFDPWRLVMSVLNSDLFGRLVGIERVLAAVNISVTAFVSYPDDPEVCSTGLRIGPYTFAGDVDSPVTSDSDSERVQGETPRIHVVKSGSFEVCIVINPLLIPMDAYLTVDALQVEALPCEEPAPADNDVLGSWSGRYTCTNYGIGSDVDLPITLSIGKNPDGSYTYTDDSGANYNGHFCGDKFRYRGGVSANYTESGTFWLTGAGTAMKESNWNSIPVGLSGGDCIDDLTKD
jgi:hypothetical protein